MFDSIWKNINIATMIPSSGNDGFGIIENAVICIKDGTIAFAGAAADVPPHGDARIFDGENRWVTPGLIDCHTHLCYAGNRADEFEKRLHGVSYAEIAATGGGILATQRATREADDEKLYQLTLERLMTLFQQGVTGIEIKSGYGLDIDTERKMLRVITRVRDELGFPVQRSFLAAHAVPPAYAGRPDDYIEHICRDMIPALAAEGLIDAVDGFCEKIAFDTAQIARVFQTAQAHGLPVKLHAEQLSFQGGVKLAAQYRALSADHLEYLDEDSIRAMADSGTTAVLLPAAFYYLRETRVPPVDMLRQCRVPMAVATDHNPGTAPVLSPTTVMNMACVLFGLTPAEALAGMTINAARALGWATHSGTVAAGKHADLAIWNIDHPRDIVAAIGAAQCYGVIAGGDVHIFA